MKYKSTSSQTENQIQDKLPETEATSDASSGRKFNCGDVTTTPSTSGMLASTWLTTTTTMTTTLLLPMMESSKCRKADTG